jgi:hypothetical protein
MVWEYQPLYSSFYVPLVVYAWVYYSLKWVCFSAFFNTPYNNFVIGVLYLQRNITIKILGLSEIATTHRGLNPGATFTTIHSLCNPQRAQLASVLYYTRLEGLTRENTLAYWAHSYAMKNMKCCECTPSCFSVSEENGNDKQKLIL